MQTSIQHINTLPMPTWRWLGVNEAGFEGELPDILPLLQVPNPALPAGIASLTGALAQEVLAIEGIGAEAETFVANHRNTGIQLQVLAGQRIAQPLVYHYTLGQGGPTAVVDSVIVAQPGSDITIVQVFSSGDDSPHLHAGRTRILALENSRVNLIQLQLLNAHSVNISSVGALVHKGARVHLTQAELGAGQSYTGSNATLAGQGAHMQNNTLYLGGGNQKLDYNYITRHLAPETTSEMQAAGALFGNCQKIYRGTIDFVAGAARSVGHQQENILLFSPTARNRTVPLILCGEENVEGQHAATIGRIDDAKLFYMQSRGLSQEQVKHLMVHAQFAPLVAQLPEGPLPALIEQRLTERMHEV